MNRKQVESQIVMAHTFNDKSQIQKIYIDLINYRSKLDRWFNKYLDMFDEKMNESKRTDPVWRLYNAKSEEYSDVNMTIKTAEYYLKKP
jgi:hypothetical protein